MTPEYQEHRALTQEEQAQLRAAEADLAADIRDAGEAAKNKSNNISPDLLNILQETERTQFVRSLVEVQVSQDLFAQDARLARVFALSGAFADIKGTTPQQAIAMAMTKIRLGRSWGLSESDAMQFIYFNNGRPAVMNELIAAKLYESGLEWDIRWHQANGKCTGCTLHPKVRKNGGYEYLMEVDPNDPAQQRKVEVSFTKAEADIAMIWEKGKQVSLSSKWNFQSWAQDMYYWRCVGRLKRRYRPNVLRGAVTQYEVEEIAPPEQPAYKQVIAETQPPDADPRWMEAGSKAAAQAVAEQKIAEMKARGAVIREVGTMPEPEAGELSSPASTEAAVTESASGTAAQMKPAVKKLQFGGPK